MMGCFSTSRTDGTEESHHVSLRSLMAAKQTPIPSPCIAKKIIERKLGLNTRKTLQARTSLLDTACHNLAKAKQRTLVSFPPSNYYLKSDTTLFPLPLPPGYKPSTNNTKSSSLSKSRSLSKSSSNSIKSKRSIDVNSTNPTSNSIKSKRIDVNSTNPTSNFPANDTIHVHSSDSSNSPTSPHSNSSTTITCNSSCEDLTPSSTTSSSVFSSATLSLSQSFSFSSSSTNSSDLRRNSLAHAFYNESSFFTPLPPPPPPPYKIDAVASPLKEFSPLDIARACDNFDDTYKLRDGSMGPFYRAFLPEEQSIVAIARVATELSRKKWRAQMQMLGRLAHPNLCKVIGFSYERGRRKGMEGGKVVNTGLIVYESIGNESLEEFVQDVEKGHSHIDWSTRLNIAIGVAEGLSFLLQSHVSYGDLTMSNIVVDLSSNAKLFDFVLSSTSDQKKEKKLSDVVQAFGNVLLKLFDFVSYREDVDTRGLKDISQMEKLYPSKDSKLVIQLAASCLLAEDSLRPSLQHVACVLHSIEPTQDVAKFSMNRSRSFIYRKKKSLSFG